MENMRNIEELYIKFKNQGLSDDEAYTEAYSVICNMDEEE
jgi:hypothetical protein